MNVLFLVSRRTTTEFSEVETSYGFFEIIMNRSLSFDQQGCRQPLLPATMELVNRHGVKLYYVK